MPTIAGTLWNASSPEPLSINRLPNAAGAFARMTLFVFMLLLVVGARHPVLSQTKEAIEKTEIANFQNYYATLDPHYQELVSALPQVRIELEDLQARVTAVQAAHPGESEAELVNCLKVLKTALARTNSAIQLTEIPQYGVIRALLAPASGESDDENRLAKVLACLKSLKGALDADPQIAAASTRLAGLRDLMEAEFAQIDFALARRKAKSALRRVEAGSCGNINFQEAQFKVRDIRLDDPFKFLPWVKIREQHAEGKIRALFKDDPLFTYKKAAAQGLDIIETENFLPDTSDKRVKLRLEIVRVENCTNGELDLAYGVFSTQIMPVLSSAPESRVADKQEPQKTAGQTTVVGATPKPIHFTPLGGYDSTDLISGGGRLEITPRSFGKLPIGSIIVQGQASSRMHYVSAALASAADFSAESTDASSWLAHAEWQLAFTHYALPTGAGQIKGGHLSAQFSGMSKPLAGGNLTFRFGGQLEGGNSQGDVRSLALAADTVASDGFGTLKLYAGLESRLRHHVLSASYGLELGSIGPTTRVDWRKQIVDVRHDFWKSIGNHRILDLESRFTLGQIQVPGKIPLPERFFGGNNEELFISGDTWEIRANPVIRAIPASTLFRTSGGAGSKKFVTYNLTAAYAVWRKTLVPEELTADPEFTSELAGAITTVTSTLQNYYASKDPHYANVVAKLPAAQTNLDTLKTAVAASQASHPDQSPDLFKACARAVGGALRRINSAITPQGGDQFGLITFLLSDDPDEIQIAKAIQACGTDLNGAIQDPAIAAAVSQVNNDRQAMVIEFNLIDQSAAGKKASDDMAFTRRTLGTLFNDVNIYSVSPVFVFDVAKIAPSSGGLGGIRYGPGLGIRLELASVAHFTAGYAWNVRRGIGEGRGNIFFAIGIRDLFR
jgi:hypothetical protein